jgi:hypothetical protein
MNSHGSPGNGARQTGDKNASADATARKVARALTTAELAGVLDTIARAANSGDLLHSALRAVFDALLEGAGESPATPVPTDPDEAIHSSAAADRRVNPSDYAIPAAQWQAITSAITNRAAEWGTGALLAFELINLMPAAYEDPAVPAPATARTDYRPHAHHLEASRDATDTIAACEAHVQALGRYFGWQSPPYLNALTSWHRQLARLFGMGLGAHTRISKDGDRSLLVTTASGIVFGVIFHGAPRHCTADGCAATILDDGRAYPPYQGAPALDHEHTPSYPLDAPRPGEWSFHS